MKIFKADKRKLINYLAKFTSFSVQELRSMSYNKINNLYISVNPNLAELIKDEKQYFDELIKNKKK